MTVISLLIAVYLVPDVDRLQVSNFVKLVLVLAVAAATYLVVGGCVSWLRRRRKKS